MSGHVETLHYPKNVNDYDLIRSRIDIELVDPFETDGQRPQFSNKNRMPGEL